MGEGGAGIARSAQQGPGAGPVAWARQHSHIDDRAASQNDFESDFTNVGATASCGKRKPPVGFPYGRLPCLFKKRLRRGLRGRVLRSSAPMGLSFRWLWPCQRTRRRYCKRGSNFAPASRPNLQSMGPRRYRFCRPAPLSPSRQPVPDGCPPRLQGVA